MKLYSPRNNGSSVFDDQPELAARVVTCAGFTQVDDYASKASPSTTSMQHNGARTHFVLGIINAVNVAVQYYALKKFERTVPPSADYSESPFKLDLTASKLLTNA